MGILQRAKRILKSHVGSAIDDFRSGRAGVDVDPLSDDAAGMDDDEWYRAVKARQAAQEQARRQRERERRAPHQRLPLEIEQAYETIQCPVGADLASVRTSWKRLLKKCHPDLFQGEPAKQEAAARLAARVNEAFHMLEAHLQARGDKG